MRWCEIDGCREVSMVDLMTGIMNRGSTKKGERRNISMICIKKGGVEREGDCECRKFVARR